MSESNALHEDPEPQKPAPGPDTALTLDAKRLAGSAACLNCGEHLHGPYCHYCGQPDRNFLRFFPALMREFLEEFLDLDSRFSRTMRPLLFVPGKLSRDFLDGQRFRYTPPMRLYLFSSIAFFIIAAFLSSGAIDADKVSASMGSGKAISISASSEEELAKVQQALDQLPADVKENIELDLAGAEISARDSDFFDEGQINITGEPWHPVDNPVAISWLPQSFNDWINRQIEESPEKADRINQDPNIIIDQIFDILPGAMFVLLPVVALIFKFWYLFAGRYYIEHLILALHNHSFIFVSLIGMLLLEALETWAGTRNHDGIEKAAIWSSAAVGIWIPIYLVLSLKRVYQQGWLLTLAKGFVIGLSYFTLLILIVSMVGLLGFLML